LLFINRSTLFLPLHYVTFRHVNTEFNFFGAGTYLFYAVCCLFAQVVK